MVGLLPLAPHHDSLQYIHHVHLMQRGQNWGVTVSHQRRSKKMKTAKTESSSSSEGFGERKSYHTTSDSSEAKLYDRKKKYRRY